MSTLPFLLSVADELDNINSQSYMDDFGLGFHPHRQFYRTPTIQLSLPAGTDWMQQDTGRHHGSTSNRYRSYKCYTDNHLQSITGRTTTGDGFEENHPDDEYLDRDDMDNSSSSNHCRNYISNERGSTSTSAAASAKRAQKFVSALNSNVNRNEIDQNHEYDHDHDHNHYNDDDHNDDNDEENAIDRLSGLTSLSKKCGKNYYRHNKLINSSTSTSLSSSSPSSQSSSVATVTTATSRTPITGATFATTTNSASLTRSRIANGDKASNKTGNKTGLGYRLHSKCFNGNNSSSEESLQKVTSSIEFLTCFLLKKSRASSKESPTTSTTATNTPSSRQAADNKKS